MKSSISRKNFNKIVNRDVLYRLLRKYYTKIKYKLNIWKSGNKTKNWAQKMSYSYMKIKNESPTN